MSQGRAVQVQCPCGAALPGRDRRSAAGSCWWSWRSPRTRGVKEGQERHFGNCMPLALNRLGASILNKQVRLKEEEEAFLRETPVNFIGGITGKLVNA